MRVLYLAFESRKTDPIIDSQVVSLLDEVLNFTDIITSVVLLTFGLNKINDVENRKFIKQEKINKGFLMNTISLCSYLCRNNKKFDIIHVRSYLPMLAVVMLKPFLKAKIIFDPRGVYPEEILYLFGKKNIPYYFFLKLEFLFCKMSNAIIVVSTKFREHYLERYDLDKNKIFVIPTFSQKKEIYNTHKVEFFNLKKDFFKKDDAIIFGFSGSYGNWQLTDEIFDFFKLASEKIDNSVFVIFSKEVHLFENKVKELGIDHERFFIKSLNKAELQTFMKQIDYGLLFRDNNLVNKVAAPIKVKDYLINGVKIIMTANIGDDSDFVSNNQIGYIMEDISKENMLKIINNIKLNVVNVDRTHIVKITEKEFDVNKSAKQTLDVYLSC